MNAPPPGRPPRQALVYRAVGLLALSLAAIGILLPVMPTTVFLIIALWAFARGSPEWADRLRRNARFGPYIRDWEERGAIPTRAKVLAVSMMAVSWAIVAFTTHNGWIAAAVGVVLVSVAAYVVTRPAA